MRCGQTEGINAEHGPTGTGPSRGSSAEPTGAEGTPHTHLGEEKLPGVRGAAHKPHEGRGAARATRRPPTAPPQASSHSPPPDRNGPSIAGPRGKTSGRHTATPGRRLGAPRAEAGGRCRPCRSAPLTSAGSPSTERPGAAAWTFEIAPRPRDSPRAPSLAGSNDNDPPAPGAFWAL